MLTIPERRSLCSRESSVYLTTFLLIHCPSVCSFIHFPVELDSVNSTESADTDRVSDIDGLGMFDAIFCLTLSNHLLTYILRYVHAHRLHELLPNVSVALRILLTVRVTVYLASSVG